METNREASAGCLLNEMHLTGDVLCGHEGEGPAHTLSYINVSRGEANETPALIFLGLSSLSST